MTAVIAVKLTVWFSWECKVGQTCSVCSLKDTLSLLSKHLILPWKASKVCVCTQCTHLCINFGIEVCVWDHQRVANGNC